MENKKLSLVLCGLLLTGCGSDGSGSESEQASATASEINNLVATTNSGAGFPGFYTDNSLVAPLVKNGLVRFDTTAQIPLYYVSADGSQPPQQIIDGVASIEARLGDIFNDFTLLTDDLTEFRDAISYPSENRGNGSYAHDDFVTEHGLTNGGLIFSLNTAFFSTQYGTAQNMCGNASTAPYSGSLNLVIDQNSHTYSADSLLWVNLDNTQGCTWDTDMVRHEMAHAMGMYQHLNDYFGSWSTTAMNILATMYSNPAGTPYNSLTPDMH